MFWMLACDLIFEKDTITVLFSELATHSQASNLIQNIFYPFLCKNFSFNWTFSLFLMSCNLLLNDPKFWFSASFKPLCFEWPGTSDNLAGSQTIVRDRWFEIPWFYVGFSNFYSLFQSLFDFVSSNDWSVLKSALLKTASQCFIVSKTTMRDVLNW